MPIIIHTVSHRRQIGMRYLVGMGGGTRFLTLFFTLSVIGMGGRRFLTLFFTLSVVGMGGRRFLTLFFTLSVVGMGGRRFLDAVLHALRPS